MKATGLMVGDWVICNDLKRQVAAIGETVGFLDCNNQVYWAYEGFDRIDPIPLTEEILVKNGFEKRIYTSPSNNEDYLYYQWNPTPEYPDEGVWLWPDGDSYTYNSRISDININYVHILQHLLRLVGIEKDIEL